MTMHFNEAKSWSIISPKPVFVGEAAYWRGLFMSKSTAFAIAGAIFLKCGITPNMKEHLAQSTLEEYNKALDEGHTFTFSLIDTDGERHPAEYVYGHLSHRIAEYVHSNEQAFADWYQNPIEVYRYFVIGQE